MREGVTEDLYAHVAEYREHRDYTERERLAIEYAERFALDHQAIDDDLWARLRGAFTDAEVLDLTICVASFLALGRVMAVLGIEPIPAET